MAIMNRPTVNSAADSIATMAWEDLPDESLILAAAGALDAELNVLAKQLPTAIREANPGASDAAIARFVDRYGSGWIVGPGGKPYDLCGEGALNRLAGLLASCEDPT